ncbi:inositol monophosphatase family protein [Kitasatospora atroaurantiaca]|uniref:Inositol-1-monophosphatase n=1 Tax=Kitasatospora atroaurantiaca TaxID=285545 RepID=A0A561EWG3_9ACTN|nr:inositol monophosphatase family protein [Kitasatospora atroaurantiaca]TWE19933.1 myo-inositol-1(or 4)-monophosphatase [Kitasatospora atroaurantiaca]
MPNPELLAELLDVAVEAATRAGALLRDGRPADLGVAATKSSPVDVVTEMDLASEKLILELIGERRPEDGYLGEEGADRPGTSGVRWVVDPLDGTVNYLYGLPSWGVSVGVEVDGRAVVGVVAVPARDELFHAVLGGGAFLNGRPVSCRPAPPWGQALVGTGFNYVQAVRVHQAEVLLALMPEVRDIRRAGAAAVDLCDVAAGRLDAFYERGLQPWDMAAGVLIAREAGARSGGRPGEEPHGGLTVTAPPGAFEQLQARLEELGAWHD